MEFTPTRIIWHHSGDDSEKAQLAKIEAYHAERTFPMSARGYHVGYHYLIEQNGDVIQCRNEDEIGAHDQGENINSIGICLAGNFSLRYPSTEATQTAARLIWDITRRHNIPITRIEPHRVDDDTECPGKLLRDSYLVDEMLRSQASLAVRLFYWLGKQYNLL